MDLLVQVADILKQIAAEDVMPRFRRLPAEDIFRKASVEDAEDVVTTVDRAVEQRLSKALHELRPDATIIGEEGVHASPDLLASLQPAGSFWLVDPIDGTRNFIGGDDAFGIAVALVQEGETRAAWLAFPARGQLFAAEKGDGAFLNGQTVRRSAAAHERLRGTIYARFMPAHVHQAIERAVAGKYDDHASSGCGAIEYATLVLGDLDFAIYFRLLPWDHAPGALILTEAGGVVDHVDGRRYTPLSANQVTVLARTPQIAYEVRGWLAEPQT